MSLVEFVSRPMNYAATAVDYVIKKIATTPSASKKVYQITCKVFAAFDLYYTGKTRQSEDDLEITKAFKGTIALIEFYASYKDVMYWVNLFSKESLDKEFLKQSIEDSLSISHRDPNDTQQQKIIANQIFQEVMAVEKYHSKGEVLEAIRVSLGKHGYTDKSQINKLVERIIIKQQARPITQNLYMACFTIADLGVNILTLQKWKILDLSQLAATIGSQSPIFMFVLKLGADKVLGTIASAGLTLAVGEAAYRVVVHGTKLYHAENLKDIDKSYQELRNALLDFTAAGVDLIALSAPLLCVLNPSFIVGLAIFAKGTGLICILIR